MQQPLPVHTVAVTPAEQAALAALKATRRSSQQLVGRINIIEAVASGQASRKAAATLQSARNTVILWRNRWEALAAERDRVQNNPKALKALIVRHLSDGARPGAPPTFTPEQVARIMAIACEDPADSNRTVSHWSTRELADEAMKRGIVPAISERQVGRFLKRGQSETVEDPVLAASHAEG